ncbi:MAG: hypothetical protein ABFQ62_01660 [Patescibacteria group bacterium]
MKKKKVVRKNFIIGLSIFLLTIYLIYQGFLWIISNKFSINAYCSDVKSFIELNNSTFETVFTNSFDVAVACRTEKCKTQQVNQTMLSLEGSDKLKFYQTSYLIRLNTDGNIEKWFWSGDVKTTIPTTDGEKQVTKLLRGKSSPICTQNWKLDSGETHMTYLKDAYSEAEIIIPIKSDRKVIGAFVSRWGD